MTAQHLSVDELADAAEGLIDPERAGFAESHIAGCADCRAQSEALHAPGYCAPSLRCPCRRRWLTG
jgi:anti-sigma factor RsiW